MAILPPKLVSLDVGGTIGSTKGKTITAILATASNLPTSEVRRILRSTLHIAPKVTDVLIDTVCRALEVERACFPMDYVPPPFQLYPWALLATKSLSKCAPVVTLSNVSCLDFEIQILQASLGDYITTYYSSCELGYAKPAPQAFRAVVEQHRVSMASLVHIGDSWECDVMGALSAGARAVWISGGHAVPNDELNMYSDRLIVARDITEASEYLLGL
jgi:FMN phosphatase YigB (HAD superfamily)